MPTKPSGPTANFRHLNIGTNDLAELLAVDPRRVAQLVDDGTITKSGRGTYHMASCVQGYIAFLRENRKLTTNASAMSALNIGKTKLVELQALEKEGGITDAALEQARSALAEVIGMIGTSVRSIPARITRDVALRRKIEDEIERALREASKAAERAGASDEAGDGDFETSEEAELGTVGLGEPDLQEYDGEAGSA
jgi:phage terminase Nu1 subunit (DNA packaging protein)